jgi:hypothetical protein
MNDRPDTLLKASGRKVAVDNFLEHRLPGWLAAALVLIVILGIKFITS